jgi:Protein of unknown function (DUF551)
MSGRWADIETAPKDGTEFLAFDGVAKKCGVAVWSTVWEHFDIVQSDGEYGPDEDQFQGARITHWMPLPEPPA